MFCSLPCSLGRTALSLSLVLSSPSPPRPSNMNLPTPRDNHHDLEGKAAHNTRTLGSPSIGPAPTVGVLDVGGLGGLGVSLACLWPPLCQPRESLIEVEGVVRGKVDDQHDICRKDFFRMSFISRSQAV